MIATPLFSWRELAAFGAVGAAAATVHFGVVMLLVLTGAPPLGANVAGFLAAFGVSFVGHERVTFRSATRAKAKALRRFALVAAVGFWANELLYAVLLACTSLGYGFALAIVLITVAMATLAASKLWAFRDARA